MDYAWLVRPVPNGINRVTEFKNRGIIAVGWPEIGNLSGKSREELKQILSKEPYYLSALALGNAYATIDIFVNQMHEGDLVLMPNGDDVYFGRITSEYYLDVEMDNQEEGYPHQRTVQWVADTSRKELSKELRSALKVHRTTANLSNYYQEIESFCNGTEYTGGNETGTIEVTYPLRADFNIHLNVPADMTRDEATRLSTFLATLYYEI